MDEIASKLKDTSPVVEVYPNEHIKRENLHQLDFRSADLSKRASDSPLSLTIDKIDSPAYLVNHNLEIIWINKEAEDQIFNRSISEINEQESRNVFKLFFNYKFQEHLRNWEEMITFHIPYMKSNFAKSHIPKLYKGISETEVKFLENIYDQEIPFTDRTVQNQPVNCIMKNGTTKPYQVHSIFFREGIFFVYIPSDKLVNDIMELLSRRETIINELLKQRMPSLVSLCVLVADLQDSVKISAELLPGEYFDLINQLWESLSGTFEKYSGVIGKHAGDGMLYYFINRPGSNYIMHTITCALEIREKMKEFSREWQAKKGWFNEIFLNIGINEGQEFFGTIRSASNLEFTALGDSINYAGRLSDFARYGEIWTTKNVISKLEPEDVGRIRFGVHKEGHERKVFIPNSFSRVIDLLDNKNKINSKYLDIATIPVAEIQGIK